MSREGFYKRWEVSEDLWERIKRHIPRVLRRNPKKGGRPRVPERKVMNGILFVLKTGCQWNALNATGICSSSTAHLRFQEWVRAGVFAKLWEEGLAAYDELKGIEWKWQSMDGAMTKAPLGGEKNRVKPYRQSQKRDETIFAY